MNISIGICAYNEENNIGNLLKNLSEQHLPQAFKLKEIIVVSSGSTDRTDEIVSKVAGKDQRIKLISEKERGGKAQALNIFFDVTKGDILVIISADTKPTQGSLAKLIGAMKKEKAGGACANTIPKNKNQTFLDFWNIFLWKVSNKVLYEEWKHGTLSRLGGDMWAIKKGIVSHIPKNIINDDAFLGMALKKKGWQIAFVPSAKVFIAAPRTITEYIQQRERIVIGHKQIEKVMGLEPVTISAMASKKPCFSLKIIVDETRTCKFYDYPKIFAGIFLEMIAQALARTKLKKKGEYLKWKQIQSTKILN